MIRMNDIQQQIIQISGFVEKYGIVGEDKQLLLNGLNLLINALIMIENLGLEDELIKRMKV